MIGEIAGEGGGEIGEVVAFGDAVADADVVGGDAEGAELAGEGTLGELRVER